MNLSDKPQDVESPEELHEAGVMLPVKQEAPKPLAVIDHDLRQMFLRIRRKILQRVYVAKRHGYGREMTKKGRAEFIRKAGKRERYSYDPGRLPSQQYLMERIMPTVYSMADTREEIETIARDAMEMLSKLMVGQMSSCQYHVTAQLLTTFFSNDDIDEDNCPWRHNASGQFKYFYSRYGKWPTMAVAIHQGWECDRHYGDGDYTNGLGELLRLFGPALKAVPAELHEPAFRAFVNYGGHHSAHCYIKEMPKVVTALRDAGKEGYLPDYFALAECAPDIDPQHGECRSWPVLSPESVIPELDALQELGEYKEDGLMFAKQIILHSESYSHSYKPSFRSSKDKDDERWYLGEKYSIPDIIQHLADGGYTSAQIKNILKIPKSYPWLGNVGLEIAANYLELDKNFPGGAKALIAYLKTIKNGGRRCLHNLTHACQTGAMPAENTKTYLERGVRLVKNIGPAAEQYFYSWLHFEGEKDKHIKMQEENPEAFAELVSEAEKYALMFPAEVGIDVRKKVFEYFMKHCNDPKLPELKRAFEIIASAMHEFFKKNRKEDTLMASYKFWHGFGSIMESFEKILHVFHDHKKPFQLPDVNIEDQAKILVAFCKEGEDDERRDGYSTQHTIEYYSELLDQGLDYRIASRLQLQPNRDGKFLVLGARNIEGMDAGNIPEEKMKRLVDTINATRECVALLLKTSVHGLRHERRRLLKAPQDQDLSDTDEEQYDNLARQIGEIDKLGEDPDFKDLIDFSAMKSEAEGAMRIAHFKQMIGISMHTHEGRRVQMSDFGSNTNETTQAAIASTSLMMALGMTNVGVKGWNAPIQIGDGNTTSGFLTKHAEENPFLLSRNHAFADRFRRELVDNIQRAIPQVESAILNARRSTPGLMPIGAKIHTLYKMDENMLEFFMDTFGLRSTPFHLIHAGHSLVLPPMMSALELQCIIYALEKFGLIDGKHPDIQVAAAGSWNQKTASIVGSSILLGTDRGVQYAPGAFSTNQDGSTGARIMARDAGVKISGLPFDIPGEKRRVDKLGNHSLRDIERYQLMATLATHRDHDKRFAPIAHHLFAQHRDLLRVNDLDGIVDSTDWIYDDTKAKGSLGDHERMIGHLSGRWMQEARQPGYGLIGQINRMLHESQAAMQAQKPHIIRECQGDFRRLMIH